jgi:hypothetical protein
VDCAARRGDRSKGGFDLGVCVDGLALPLPRSASFALRPNLLVVLTVRILSCNVLPGAAHIKVRVAAVSTSVAISMSS